VCVCVCVSEFVVKLWKHSSWMKTLRFPCLTYGNALNYNQIVLEHIFNVLQLMSNTGCRAENALNIINISTWKKFNHFLFHY